MKLQTEQFGELEFDENEVITFPNGIPGFEDLHEFILFHIEEYAPFSILQSAEDGTVSFIVTDPFLFFKEFEFELPQSAQEQLDLGDDNNVLILGILTLQGALEEATINLQAPIVINSKARLGKQVILHDSAYQTKHKIYLNENK